MTVRSWKQHYLISRNWKSQTKSALLKYSAESVARQWGKQYHQQEDGDVAPTLSAGSNGNIRYVETIYRIRKLTPRECWRLMGYTDADFDNAAKVNSNSQLYKQAGNAIVKQVLMAIFAQMIPESARKL